MEGEEEASCLAACSPGGKEGHGSLGMGIPVVADQERKGEVGKFEAGGLRYENEN